MRVYASLTLASTRDADSCASPPVVPQNVKSLPRPLKVDVDRSAGKGFVCRSPARPKGGRPRAATQGEDFDDIESPAPTGSAERSPNPPRAHHSPKGKQ
jgi:hypothetical protein